MSVFEDDDEKEVFAHFGLATYMAQVLEHEMVNTLTILLLLPRRHLASDASEWASQVDEFMDAHFAKTFGNLMRALEISDVPDGLLEDLNACKAKRDFLAHSFFREYAAEFLTPAGRRKMISYADEARDQFDHLNRELEAFSSRLARRYGITPKMIEDEYRRMNPAG